MGRATVYLIQWINLVISGHNTPKNLLLFTKLSMCHLKIKNVLLDKVVLAQCNNWPSNGVQVRVVQSVFVAGRGVWCLQMYVTASTKHISKRHI